MLGHNDQGQLGYGHTDDLGDDANEMGDSLAPVDLGAGRTAIAVAGGAEHTCAVLENSEMKCWGEGSFGRLGVANNGKVGDQTDEMGDDLPAVNLGTGLQIDVCYAPPPSPPPPGPPPAPPPPPPPSPPPPPPPPSPPPSPPPPSPPPPSAPPPSPPPSLPPPLSPPPSPPPPSPPLLRLPPLPPPPSPPPPSSPPPSYRHAHRSKPASTHPRLLRHLHPRQCRHRHHHCRHRRSAVSVSAPSSLAATFTTAFLAAAAPSTRRPVHVPTSW